MGGFIMGPNNSKVYCKMGREINSSRISKYEGFYRKIIRDFLPGLCLMEASMAYDDLLNQLRYEAFMALKNGFDPIKAMDSTIKDPEKRAKQIEKKLANPQKALEQAEKNIVYGRLVNYMRRSRWKYHPDQRGGKSISLESILIASNNNFNSQSDDVEYFIVHNQNHIDTTQAENDKAELLKALENGKDVKLMYNSLSKERQEDLLEILKNTKNDPVLLNFDPDENNFFNESADFLETKEYL